MKILSTDQIRELDAHTIEHEPISSTDLMERAARTFTSWFVAQVQPEEGKIHILCGIGNNGGDGLAVARMLHRSFYSVQVWMVKVSDGLSDDCRVNLGRLPHSLRRELREIKKGDKMPDIESGILIDAVFGSGLNRPVEGYWAKLFNRLNETGLRSYAIDIPSGLYADKLPDGAVLDAHATFSFELPKLAFFLIEAARHAGQVTVASIGLDEGFIRRADTHFYYTGAKEAGRILREREEFSHKGTYGHALLMCGSLGSIGAALMAGEACLRAGAGLLTIHAPKCGYEILQSALPEAMVSIDLNQNYISCLPDINAIDAVGIGCGIGKKDKSKSALKDLLSLENMPKVLDADALNLLSEEKSWLGRLNENCLLTPHPGEFKRLFGESKNSLERLEMARNACMEYGFYMVLKGHRTAVIDPDGRVWFNSTGNAGMATGGSGDVLTGILTGLIAQRYSLLDAARLGVYLHGLAGDLAIVGGSEEALIATDIIALLGCAFKEIRDGK